MSQRVDCMLSVSDVIELTACTFSRAMDHFRRRFGLSSHRLDNDGTPATSVPATSFRRPIPYLRSTAGGFDQNLGLALGFANAGIGLGVMLVPLITTNLIGGAIGIATLGADRGMFGFCRPSMYVLVGVSIVAALLFTSLGPYKILGRFTRVTSIGRRLILRPPT